MLRRRTSAGTRPGGRENPICSAVAAGGPAVPWPARHAGWTRLKTVQRTPRGRALRGRTPERPRIRPWVRSGRGGSRYAQWQRAGICAVKRVRPMTSTTPGVHCASARPSRVPIAGFVELVTRVRPPYLLRLVRFGCCNRSRAAASLPTHVWPRPSACHAGPGHVRPLAALIVGEAGQAGAVSRWRSVVQPERVAGHWLIRPASGAAWAAVGAAGASLQVLDSDTGLPPRLGRPAP